MVGSPGPTPTPLKISPQLYLRPWEEQRGIRGQKLPFVGASPSWAGQSLASEPPLLTMATRPFVAIATPETSNLDHPESQFSANAGENVSLRSSCVTDAQGSMRWPGLPNSHRDILQKWLLLFSCWLFPLPPHPVLSRVYSFIRCFSVPQANSPQVGRSACPKGPCFSNGQSTNPK